MKKRISLEHQIRSIREDSVRDAIGDAINDITAPAKKKLKSWFGTAANTVVDAAQTVTGTSPTSRDNTGVYNFGVYPQGTPSIENTRRLMPSDQSTHPLELQRQQQQQRQYRESLEHSIRNIVSETVGNLVDPKESHLVKAAFNKPVQIEPPEGEEHGSVRALNVSNQRKQIKQAESQTRETFAEDALNEFAPPKGTKVPVPDELLDLVPGFKPAPTKPPVTKPVEVPTKPSTPVEPAPVETPIVPKPVKPVPVKPTQPLEPAPVEIPNYTPAPAKPAKEAPSKPAPVEVPSEPTPTVDPGPGPRVKPSTPTKTEPGIKTEPKVETQPKIETETPTKVTPKTETATPPRAKTPAKTTTKPAKPSKPFIPPFFGSPSAEVLVGQDAPKFPVKTHLHAADPRKIADGSFISGAVAKQILKKSAMKEEADRKNIQLVDRDKKDRKKVEYVGRDKLNAKTTLGRQAAYKQNVIDEEETVKPSRAAKIKSIVLDKKETGLGENPIVEKEPRLKPLHLGENSRLSWPVAGKGLQYGLTAGNVEKMSKGEDASTMGPNMRTSGTGRNWLNPTKDVVPAMGSDVAKSVAAKTGSKALQTGARFVPGLSTVYGLGLAGYRAAKGDMTGAGLAAASAIPGPVGWAATAADLGRELSKSDEEKPKDEKKPEVPKTEPKPSQPAPPVTSDQPAAQAAEPKKPKSIFDSTPVKNQGM